MLSGPILKNDPKEQSPTKNQHSEDSELGVLHERERERDQSTSHEFFLPLLHPHPSHRPLSEPPPLASSLSPNADISSALISDTPLIDTLTHTPPPSHPSSSEVVKAVWFITKTCSGSGAVPCVVHDESGEKRRGHAADLGLVSKG